MDGAYLHEGHLAILGARLSYQEAQAPAIVVHLESYAMAVAKYGPQLAVCSTERALAQPRRDDKLTMTTHR